jgi:hypothetical protein
MESGESTKQTDNPKGQAHRGLRRRRRDGSGAHDSSRKFTKYVLVPALVLAVLGLIAYLTHQPALRALRAWRSISVVQAATEAMESGRYDEAGRGVRVALGLAPSKLEVQKLAAKFYQAVGSPESIDYWRTVTSSPGASIEDRFAFIDACLQFSRPDVAYEQLNLLEPSVGKAPDFLRRVVRYLVVINDYDSAVPYAREAQVANPVDEEFEFILGVCLLKSSRADWVSEGWRLLTSIALASGSQQLSAARALQETSRLPLTESRQIARAIERRTNLTLADRLLVAGLRAGPDRSERETLVASVLAETMPATDEDKILCAQWAISLVTPTAAKNFLATNSGTNQVLTSLRLEALALDLDWTGFEVMVSGSTNLLDDVLIQSIEGWRAAGEKNVEKAEAKFKSAIDSAMNRSYAEMISGLFLASAWAARADLPKTAVQALEPLLGFRAVTAPAANAMIRNAARLTTVEPAYPAQRALWQYAPSEERIMVSFAHSALLLGRDLEDAIKVLRTLDTQLPTAQWPSIMLAFGLARTGKSVEAADLLEVKLKDESQLGVPMKVLLASTKFALGQKEAARQLARGIPRTGLKVEEVRILDSIE